MPDSPESRVLIESVAKAQAVMFDKVPVLYKRLLTMSDVLMVIGGLKAATDLSFMGDTWDESAFQILKSELENHGLRASVLQTNTMQDGILRRAGMIWNPETLKRETQSSKYAPPYDGSQEIGEYMAEAAKNGYLMGGVSGKVYSFPDSAIRDYLAKENPGGLISQITRKRGEVKTSLTGNETYWYISPPEADIVARENAKRAFFSNLQASPVFQTVMNSDDLRKSDKEWSAHLPAFTRAREK